MKKKKLNVLVLNYEFPPLGGGASPVSYEISKGYAGLGHKVSIVTMGYKDLAKEEEKDGMKIYRIKCLRTKKEICHPWEQLSYIYSAKRFLKEHLKDNRYDMVHTHFIIPTGVLAEWIKKNYGIHYIITSHGSDVIGYNKRFRALYPLLERRWKRIIANANKVVVPSRYLLEKINEVTKEGKFNVIPNGIDKKKFRALEKENRILIVARLFPNKGIQDILDAIRGMEMKGWKIDIIGEGPYRETLEKKARENNLKEIVKFHGWLDNNSKEIKELYGKAKIFLSASHFESFGITLLEAISAGCYPLVSDIGGHRSIIEEEKHFFECKDIKGLKEKLKMLIEGKEDIEPIDISRFEYKNIVKRYEEELI